MPKCHAVKFRSCSRDTIPSTALKILRIVKGASNFVGVDVVVERRNYWLALSSEGRGPVCFGHETDRGWFANSKKLKKTYKLSSCLFFWEHFLMMQNLWGAPFHKNPMLENDWCWREIPNLHRQTASRAASRSTADVGQKIAYPWSNAFVVHGSLGIKPLKHQGSLVWVGKISIGKRLVFMILGWSLGHDWYDWHDGVGTAKFFWRWNNTHIIWYICIYLLVGFELMVESRFIWPTFFFQVSSFSEKKQRQPAVCPLIPENHTKEFRIRCLGKSTTRKCVALGEFF